MELIRKNPQERGGGMGIEGLIAILVGIDRGIVRECE